jgi:hypothetical protein
LTSASNIVVTVPMVRTASTRASLLVLAVWAVGAGRALAAGSADVEALIREGVELRQSGKDERALPLFQKAYELEHSPRTEGQLGLAEMAVNYLLDAEKHLSEALAFPEHPWIAKNAATLERALATIRASIGEITVAGGPAGATVVLNGRAAGTLPLPGPLRIAKGPADIEVRAPGYATASRSLRVAGGDRQSLTIVLDKAADATAISTPAGAAPGGGSPDSSGGLARTDVRDSGSAPTTESSGPRRTWAWVAAGAAAAAVVTGVVGTVRWQQKRSDFADHKGPPLDDPQAAPSTWLRDCGESLPSRGSAACQSLYDASKQGRTIALIGYGAGAVLAAGAAVLFRASRPEGASGPSLACVPEPPSLAMSCAIRF